MKLIRLWSAALGCVLIAGCAATPRQEPKLASCAATPRLNPKLEPWAGLREPTFPELLVSFGAANLPQDPDGTLYKYLWSQSKSYDRYEATREAHGDMAPLMQEATEQIQAGAPALACKQFMFETSIQLMKYDSARGAFPVQPYDPIRQGDMVNDVQHNVWPQIIANPNGDYGYRRAAIRVSREGWLLPATEDQAQQLRQALWEPVLKGWLSLHGIAVYTLDRCDQDPEQIEVLQCTGTMQKFYAYSHTPSLQPVYELVKDTQQDKR
ncbi:MAG: hypothetical protein OSA97_06025 [Nevskia sp.]|nr:hypothetical protein [Nevskia sp.]